MDLVGGEEAVLYALAEAVQVDRRSEVGIGVDVVPALRRRREAELDSSIEVVEDLAPGPETRPMTLIDDDEISLVEAAFMDGWDAAV